MELSIDQVRAIDKLIDALEEIKGEMPTLYGEYEPNSTKEITFIKIDIQKMQSDIAELRSSIDSLIWAMKEMENVIRPDETDVHNINRRIEILAQRISVLESSPPSLWDRLGSRK